MDRNDEQTEQNSAVEESLSARRAWIEMREKLPMMRTLKSLSARRAWIEICTTMPLELCRLVALRKESVDRNTCPVASDSTDVSRSPQGERG